MLIAEAKERIDRTAASVPGSRQLINYFVGQIVGQMNQVRPARRIVLDMIEKYIDAITGLCRSLEQN